MKDENILRPAQDTAPAQPDYRAEIRAALRSNLAPGKLRERILSYHENDAALTLPELSPEERTRFCNVLGTSALAQILDYTEDPLPYLRELNIRRRADVLTEMDDAVAADALRRMEKPERDDVLELISPDVRARLSLINSFDEDEVGSRMSDNYVSVPAGSSIKAAMSSLVRQAADNDNISTIYVTDAAGVFCGAVALTDLIIAREGTPLESITSASYPYVYASTPVEDFVRVMRDYSEDTIPVLASDNRLLGVVTAQDMTDAVADALEEDYARLGGLAEGEDLAEPVAAGVKKRLPWLVILLGLGLLVSAAVGLFEAVVARLTVVIFFQSLILDMAGNVGTQSLAVTIRVLMDDALTGAKKRRLIGREARIGLCNGLILGALAFGVVTLYLLATGSAASFALSVAGCVTAALAVSMVVSSVVGTCVPMLFSRLHVDPAVASGPLITTVNDLVAVLSYYGLAWLFLIGILHLG